MRNLGKDRVRKLWRLPLTIKYLRYVFTFSWPLCIITFASPCWCWISNTSLYPNLQVRIIITCYSYLGLINLYSRSIQKLTYKQWSCITVSICLLFNPWLSFLCGIFTKKLNVGMDSKRDNPVGGLVDSTSVWITVDSCLCSR